MDEKKKERERDQLRWRLLEKLEDAIEAGDKRRERKVRQEMRDAGFEDENS